MLDLTRRKNLRPAGGRRRRALRACFGSCSLLAALLLLLGAATPSAVKPPKGALKPSVKKGLPADNSRCFVCHLNYDGEELAETHARAGISCEKCHGSSDAHAADEDNVTAPDKMYPLAKLNAACLNCHDATKLNDENHKEVLAGTATKEKHCTDCHGEHRLKHRSRLWDRETGKLLPKEK